MRSSDSISRPLVSVVRVTSFVVASGFLITAILCAMFLSEAWEERAHQPEHLYILAILTPSAAVLGLASLLAGITLRGGHSATIRRVALSLLSLSLALLAAQWYMLMSHGTHAVATGLMCTLSVYYLGALYHVMRSATADRSAKPQTSQ